LIPNFPKLPHTSSQSFGLDAKMLTDAWYVLYHSNFERRRQEEISNVSSEDAASVEEKEVWAREVSKG